jgi:hypothetical protein
MLHKLSIIIISSLLTINGWSQDKAKLDFGDPLDIVMYLAGNFGELRSNHFHTGIDIKTESKRGLPIYAVQDGYISRVKVSGSGYGKALYMTHYNGYTSVYAHMQKFTPDIDKYVERAQYRDKTFDINLFPGTEVFTFKKGDVIGYTGNSGSSGGPHLHLELRETDTENPVNPLLFGFNIKDEIKPSIYGIMVYPIGENAMVNGKNTPQNFALGGTFGNYVLKSNQKIEAIGEIGIAVHTIDRLTGYPNKCGVYEIKMWQDTTLKFHQKMDVLDFSTKRYVNAHKDYAVFKKNRKSYHRCYLMPNNKLDIYPTLENDGKLLLKENQTAAMKVEVRDAYQNLSLLNFEITGKQFDAIVEPTTLGHQLMKYDVANEFIGQEVNVTVPAGALYDHLKFEYSNGGKLGKSVANVHRLHHNNVPLHKNITLKMKPNQELSEALKSKALIVSLDSKNNAWAIGGSWENDYLVTKTREFGTYTMMIDSTPPRIKPLTSIKSRILGNGSQIVFRISDDLSGIKSIEGMVGDSWVLLAYNPKKSKIIYTINTKYIKLGSQPFDLTITDEVGNVATYHTKIMVK